MFKKSLAVVGIYAFTTPAVLIGKVASVAQAILRPKDKGAVADLLTVAKISGEGMLIGRKAFLHNLTVGGVRAMLNTMIPFTKENRIFQKGLFLDPKSKGMMRQLMEADMRSIGRVMFWDKSFSQYDHNEWWERMCKAIEQQDFEAFFPTEEEVARAEAELVAEGDIKFIN